MKLLARNRSANRNSRIRKRLIPFFCITAIVFLLQLAGTAIALPKSPTQSPSYKPLTQIPAQAQPVTTGFYVVNLHNLDPASSTYFMDFYVWFRWKGEIDPIANLEFVNGVEDWDFSLVSDYEKPEKLPDGNQYQVLKAEGRFREPFVFTRYPLDRQTLGITIENSRYTSDELVYLGDTEESSMADDLVVSGWKIGSFQLKNLLHEYTSNFGDTRVKAQKTIFSAVRYEILLSRPLSFFIWKLLLPLSIVLIACWGALLLYPLYADSRIVLPVTALLTTVFLQQSYSAAIPEVGYLVLLDKIYALAYFIIIIAMLEAIFTASWSASEKPEDIERVMRLDRFFLIGLAVILVVGVALLILF